MPNSKQGELLWLDFEFTGLNVHEDIVIEVGCLVTDFSFLELAKYSSFIYHEKDTLETLLNSNPWWDERPEHKQKMMEKVAEEGKPKETVSAELGSFAANWCKQPVLLAGNTIYNDRKWIDAYFPELNEQLHYRMLDVSSLKILGSGLLGLEYEKIEAHRAISDINESIDELKFLLEAFRTPR